ncbi:hypothetical protein ACFQ07_30150 [Actinomadura adrarensis]|uniref:Uncharacterized protein n=1 Tax=Actinomadura adrarensis TaxID=1819600 RepID=A0ABW3CRB8_9ACTN
MKNYNGVIRFGKRGELASNSRVQQESGIPAELPRLHQHPYGNVQLRADRRLDLSAHSGLGRPRSSRGFPRSWLSGHARPPLP